MTRVALLVALAFSTAIVELGQQPAVALGDTVEAGCGIANSGVANNNTVACNYGLTPEQFKQLTDSVVKGAAEAVGKGATEAAVKAAIEAQQKHIDKISKTHSRRQAGRGADQGRRRLQEASGRRSRP